MKFEWDESKNRANQQKHGVSFEDARTVFDDPLQIAKLDHRFSYFEERWITIGSAKNSQLLVVANLFFTDDGEEIIRIISTRQANPKERASYAKC
ncbi:MAG: BrnT family toxin [Methylococcales bacterium]